MNNITNILASTGDSLKYIGTVAKYLLYPGMIFQGLWNYTLVYSYWVCMFVALFSAIFYCFGFKKLAKYVPGSMAFYALIKMIGSALI